MRARAPHQPINRGRLQKISCRHALTLAGPERLSGRTAPSGITPSPIMSPVPTTRPCTEIRLGVRAHKPPDQQPHAHAPPTASPTPTARVARKKTHPARNNRTVFTPPSRRCKQRPVRLPGLVCPNGHEPIAYPQEPRTRNLELDVPSRDRLESRDYARQRAAPPSLGRLVSVIPPERSVNGSPCQPSRSGVSPATRSTRARSARIRAVTDHPASHHSNSSGISANSTTSLIRRPSLFVATAEARSDSCRNPVCRHPAGIGKSS